MTIRLDTTNFFHHYILHPLAPELVAKDKVIALIASICLGIVTLGITHLICAWTHHPPGTTTPATRVFQQTLPQQRSTATNRLSTILPSNMTPAGRDRLFGALNDGIALHRSSNEIVRAISNDLQGNYPQDIIAPIVICLQEIIPPSSTQDTAPIFDQLRSQWDACHTQQERLRAIDGAMSALCGGEGLGERLFNSLVRGMALDQIEAGLQADLSHHFDVALARFLAFEWVSFLKVSGIAVQAAMSWPVDGPTLAHLCTSVHPASAQATQSTWPQINNPDPLLFYESNNEGGALANTWHRQVIIDGQTWPSTEHYFQAQKLTYTNQAHLLTNFIGLSPGALQGFMRNSNAKPPLWTTMMPPRETEVDGSPVDLFQRAERGEFGLNAYCMAKALRAKFADPVMAEYLLATGERKLVENTIASQDKFWGDPGGLGQGLNMLGRMLMGLRTIISSSSATTSSLDHLSLIISRLSSGDATAQKKAALYGKARDLFIQSNPSEQIQTHRLQNRNTFAINASRDPVYFQNRFHSQPTSIRTTDQFYDYQSTPSMNDYWVDFANASLGGGCFTHGFVQEEMMVAEMPDFADHIAANQNGQTLWCNIDIRTGDPSSRNRVLQGSPNPYLLKNVHRTMHIDPTQAYGNGINQLSTNQLLAASTPVLQTVNILAIASPKLFSRNHQEQFALNTLKDNFNTIMAGIQLVREQESEPFVLHSGKLGCGAFNNHPKALFLLHCLASEETGVSICLHGYSASESQEYFALWNRVKSELENKTLQEALTFISNLE